MGSPALCTGQGNLVLTLLPVSLQCCSVGSVISSDSTSTSTSKWTSAKCQAALAESTGSSFVSVPC